MLRINKFKNDTFIVKTKVTGCPFICLSECQLRSLKRLDRSFYSLRVKGRFKAFKKGLRHPHLKIWTREIISPQKFITKKFNPSKKFKRQ